MIILVCVGWLGFANGHEQNIVGLLVNINLLFFYGAPLQTIKTVITEKSSDSIHVPTMIMNWFNTSFWALYGLVKLDPVIYLPNMVGLFFGIAQGVLCLLYPRKVEPDVDMEPLLQDAGDEAGESEDQIHSSQDSADVLL
jgi:solute carrier family 50 protein (sugar transporter)